MKLYGVLFLLLLMAGVVFAQETPYPTATYTTTATYTPTPQIYAVITLQAPGVETSQNAQIDYQITVGQIGIFGVIMMLVLIESIRLIMEWWQ